MKKDPIVEEVRCARDEYGARFGNDLKAIYADLKERERASGRRYVRFEPRRVPVGKRTPIENSG